MSDPFADPSTDLPVADLSGSEHSLEATPAVLSISSTATLTLGTDALILLDESLRSPSPSNLCGLLPQLSKTTRAIPFHNILWAEVSRDSGELQIRYTQTTGRKGKSCVPQTLTYSLAEDKDARKRAERWLAQLLERAYPPGTQRRKRIKVLVNPFGGQGYAQKLWDREVRPVFEAAGCDVEVERTTYRGHAIEIAEQLDLERWDVVACASGDGLPHEVFNGLAKHQAGGRRALRKIAVVQIPCGSGNAMSLNLNGTDSPSLAAVEIVKGVRTPLDLVAITQGERKFYSFLSQAVGIIAESDLGTESLRWMGSFRFTWGILVRVLGKTIYPAEVSVVTTSTDKRQIMDDYRAARSEHSASLLKGHLPPSQPDTAGETNELPPLRYGTVQDALHKDFKTQDIPNLGNFYVGNMCYMSPDTPFFLASLPSDGKMDMVTVPGDIPRLTALKMLATVENGGMMDFPEVEYRKVVAYRVKPRMAEKKKEIRRGRVRRKLGRWLGGGSLREGAKEGLIAVDGERVGFEEFQAEVQSGLGCVLSRSGGVYEVGSLGMR